jgi:dolichol-phosphate mannosyltransferase
MASLSTAVRPRATVDAAPHASRRLSHVLLALPAYNEEANIGSLLDRVDLAMADCGQPYEVIVVDDGSHDATPAILAEYARRYPITVLRHSENQGLGPTIRDALIAASRVAKPDDIVVTMDSDESHTPGLIPRMVRMIQEGHDVIIASRYQSGSRTYGVPRLRVWISWCASWMFRLLFPIRGVRDFTCGFRAYRASALQHTLEIYGERFIQLSGFQSMVDILLKMRRLPVICGEVPMILRYDLKRGSSKMRVMRTARQTLALILKRRLGDYS